MAFPVRRLVFGAVVALGTALAATRPWRHAVRVAAPAPAPTVSTTASAPPRPAGAAELALVAPLVPGSDLLGFTVREIRAVDHGRIRVVCVKDKAVVRLDVTLVDLEGVVPPASAGRYAVFYSLRGAAPEDGDLLARKLARILEAHAAAEPPPGMTTFTPDARPATEL